MERIDEMTKAINDPETIRLYLLGSITDLSLLSHIEERLICDDEYAELVYAAEAELIESFLDGDLDRDETRKFTDFFLASDTRKQELRLIKNLRDISPDKSEAISPTPSMLAGTRAGYFRFAQGIALGLVLVVGAIGVWKIFLEESDTERGLALLRDSMGTQRPIEGRLTIQSKYAPYSETRGEPKQAVDPTIRDRTERYLLDGVAKSGSGHAHHALGLHYLLMGEAEKAKRELDRAIELDPNNARFLSDAGAAYLEFAKRTATIENGDRTLELLNSSIGYLNRAIAIDPNLSEPRFALALCLQHMSNRTGAKEAWLEYLRLDPDSKWADDARGYLKELEDNEQTHIPTSDLRQEFISAYRDSNFEKARGLISGNRELIRGGYIPQSLAMAYSSASPEVRQEYLEALRFSGQVELQYIGDPFARDLAEFYSAASNGTINKLENAHQMVLAGNQHLMSQDYEAAMREYSGAKRLFQQTGNVWEDQLSEYFIGYILINQNDQESGRHRLTGVEEFASKRGYLWLEMTVLHWIGGSYVRSGQHSNARKAYEKALEIADRINDPYARQRNLIELANRYSFTGQITQSLRFLNRALNESNFDRQSVRQRYRTLTDAVAILSNAGFLSLSAIYSAEAVNEADRLGDEAWRSQARGISATAFAQIGDLEKSRALIQEAGHIARNISEPTLKRRSIAFVELRTGDLERFTGNTETAEKHYREAVGVFDSLNLPLNRELARRGLLLTYLAQDKIADVEAELKTYIALTEEYREKILEEEQRAGFLSARIDIYDAATELEFNRKNIETAYKYAEMATSRALLDRMHAGTIDRPAGRVREEIDLVQAAEPVTLAAVREQMPFEVQILQYSVLENTLLIWVISHEDLVVVDIGISANDLALRIATFRDRVINGSQYNRDEVAASERDFYDLLIAPVEASLDKNKQLCIIPSKSLFKLPFAVLRSSGGRYLIEDWTITVAPSASTFLQATESAKRKEHLTDESLAAVGNPSFDETKFKGLPRLADAEPEARYIGKLYKEAKVLLNSSAKKSAFMEAIGQADVVHFAGHYVPVPRMPSDSYMLMASTGESEEGSKLTNAELARIRLPVTRLVVLAACQTGFEKYDNGEEMMGLVHTTLAIDAPVVVGSQWAVDSQSTSILMKRFHQLRKESQLSTASALRQAQLEMNADGVGRYSEPRFWAAFTVFGGYASF